MKSIPLKKKKYNNRGFKHLNNLQLGVPTVRHLRSPRHQPPARTCGCAYDAEQAPQDPPRPAACGWGFGRVRGLKEPVEGEPFKERKPGNGWIFSGSFHFALRGREPASLFSGGCPFGFPYLWLFFGCPHRDKIGSPMFGNTPLGLVPFCGIGTPPPLLWVEGKPKGNLKAILGGSPLPSLDPKYKVRLWDHQTWGTGKPKKCPHFGEAQIEAQIETTHLTMLGFVGFDALVLFETREVPHQIAKGLEFPPVCPPKKWQTSWIGRGDASSPG